MAKISHLLVAGQKFGRLTIIKLDHIKKIYNRNREYYLCLCDCGNKIIVLKNNLKNNHTRSCGCYKYEISFKHGLVKTKIYHVLQNMKERCYNKNNNRYKDYGQRGINICQEWLDNPKLFYDWSINNGYKENLSIDRINNNGNYEPSNCRWITSIEQARNRRNNRLITYNGETHCMAEWSKIIGIKYSALYRRLNKLHWSIERALNN